MVLGVDYYREAIAVIEKIRPAGVPVIHSFQTNLTLMNNEWAKFIVDSDVKIGISIDGPEHIHDRNRIGRNGKGSFNKVMDGIRILDAHDIDFSAIAVLTDYSLDYAEEMFSFFVGHGITRIAFNVEEVEGVNLNSSLEVSGVVERYWRFMAEFWNLTIATKKLRVLRELEDAMASVIRPRGTPIANSLTEPFSILNIDVNGRFSTFSPEFLGFNHESYGDFCFGNLTEMDIRDAYKTPAFRRLSRDILAGVNNCKRKCEYFSVCGGGAPVNKLSENGDLSSTETMFCKLTRQVHADLALSLIESCGVEEIAATTAQNNLDGGEYSVNRPFS
jgi:uncharacterized protein